MYINFFKSAVSDKVERIAVKPRTVIKNVEALEGIDFAHTIIFVNGFQKDENYKLRENDVCTIRYFPASGGGGGGGGDNWVTELVMNILTLGGYSTTKWVMEFVNNSISSALSGLQTNYNYNYDCRDFSTHITNNIIQAQQSTKSPDMRGCTNQLETNQPYPFVIGKSYFVPRMLAKPYITPADALGTKQTYHALYDLGYNSVNVTDICLGLKKLATNIAKTRNGAITIDGDYDATKYDIHLEVQESAEVSLYNQSVVQQDINTELVYPSGEVQHGLILDEISALYPQKVEVEFYFDGLVGRIASGSDEGKDTEGTVKLKIEYSVDGGTTYQPFAKIGDYSGISYDSSTGETTITMKNYHSMRLVASKTFAPSDVLSATNHVVELRIQRTSQHVDDDYIYDTVQLACIRTYTYDPDESTVSGLVPQRPVCQKDRIRLTRLGFTITSDEFLYNLGEFNVMVQALGRTCTENNGYYTWSSELSETCNPASMVLRAMQSPMLGSYVYSDNEIDLQELGELYKFCDEYDIDDMHGNHVGICANGVVTKQMKLSDLVSKILAVGRSYRVFKNGKFSIFIDKPIANTSLILNNQNVLSASNTKDFDELPSGIKVEFVNEDNFSQSDVMYVDYADAPARSSSQYKTISKQFEFQTNVMQIKKHGLYELAKMKLRPEKWERVVSTEGCLAYVGAKIEVQDDTLAVGIGDGAEIKDLIFQNNYITKIVTDGTFDVTDLTKEYGIRIQASTLEYGLVYITRKVVFAQVGVYSTLVLDEPISIEELVLPAIGDILSFGILGKITYESICFGKKPNDNGTFTLSLVPYVADIYTADSGVLPDFDSKTTAPNYYNELPSKEITQEDLQGIRNNVIDIENGTAEIGNPDAPSDIVAVAEENGIQVRWQPVANNGLKNAIKQYVVERSIDNGDNWTALGSTFNSNYFYNFTRTGTGADGYPEASAFLTWKFRVKSENIYGKVSAYTVTQRINSDSYGTWLIPALTVIKEVIDRTVILTAVPATSNKELYGHNQIKVLIKRNGNTDAEGGQSFNQILGVTPDNTWYTPEFNESVNPSETTDTEKNYHHFENGSATTTPYVSASYKISHTLPLIGQNPRLYNGSTYVCFAIDATETSEVPLNPSENDVIHYIGVSTASLEQGKYYIYKIVEQIGSWVELIKKTMIVPTEYVYNIQMFNESGATSTANDTYAQALCTNIADIVHSHEHYKDLYVEKLSAISANIGLINQGGMGEFDQNKGNYWALSDLSPEDSGIINGIKKGAFRVGGQDQYFKVTPDPNDPEKFDIELKAGNITLTSQSDGTSFTAGTYIYDSSDSTKRLWLTATSIIAQKEVNVGTAQNPRYEWKNVAKVMTDAVGNMILTNQESFEDYLPIGTQVDENDVIYHFDDSSHPDYEEAETPTNPESITCTGDVISTKDVNPILLSESSKFCLQGTVEKNVSNFTGNVVVFNKADKIKCSGVVLTLTGIVDEASGYNTLMSETVTGQSYTYGSYLGLSASQISNGIFKNY